MEWAIHVADGSSLRHCDDFFSCPPRSSELPLSDLQAAAANVVQRVAGPVRPQRAYVGNEFCQCLIPARASFSKVCRELRERGLAITFLTPPVTDAGLDKLRSLFAWLAAQASGAEVVFNDWGTLQVLHEEFDALRPVRGRLLNKTMRDPRVTPLYNAPDAPEGIRASMQPGGLEMPSLQHLLRRYGVETVELDILLQDSTSDLRRLPFQVAFYFPYGFVTTGRQCMTGALHLEESERFRPMQRCQHECQLYLTEHRFVGTTLPTDGTAFYQRGNTFFYCPDTEVLERFLLGAEARGVGRVIYQPDLPM
jgi:hypothetical protein